MSRTCPNGHPTTATDYCDVCGAPVTDGPAGSGPPPGGGAGEGAGAQGPGGGAGGASGPAGTGAPGPAGTGPQTCASCGTENVAGALFCEACGYDFTTGAMPRAAAPAASSLDLPVGGAPGGRPAQGERPALGERPAQGERPAPEAGAAPGSPAAQGTGPAPLAPAVPLEWVVEVWVDPAWYEIQVSDEPCPSPGLPVVVPLRVRSVLVGRTSRSRAINPEVDCTPDIGVSRRHAQLTTDGTRWWVEDLQSSNGTYVGTDSGPLPTRPLTPGTRQELSEGDRVYVGAWTRLVVRRATEAEKAGPA